MPSSRKVPMTNKLNFYNFSLPKLQLYLSEHDFKKFSATQAFEWVYLKGVRDFNLMSNLALSVREFMNNNFEFVLPTIDQKHLSEDGTIKLLVKLADGNLVETVLMRYSYGNVVCVTTQVGCNMGCKFCASGLLKKKRDLSAGEMLGQVLLMNDLLKSMGESKLTSHVVLMGIGEPFDNFTNIIDFIDLLNNPKSLEIGARHITVSTCGLVPKIKEFADLKLQVKLAISLHAATDVKRNQIMPINKAYPLKEVIEAVKYYESKTNKRITYEYIMLKDFNDGLDDAHDLARLVKGTNGFVNLIPYNPVNEHDFARSPRDRTYIFANTLKKLGVQTTIRKEFGNDIDAACGQLRAKEESKRGHDR